MRSFPLPVVAALLALLPVASFAQGAPPAKPAQPAAATPAGAASAEGEEGTITGITLTRPDGRFLGVETEGVTLKVTFYDKKKKKEPADAVRISARWSDTQPRFMVLLPTTPETLVSTPNLRRPFNYIIYLALVGADDKVIETHSLRPE